MTRAPPLEYVHNFDETLKIWTRWVCQRILVGDEAREVDEAHDQSMECTKISSMSHNVHDHYKNKLGKMRFRD